MGLPLERAPHPTFTHHDTHNSAMSPAPAIITATSSSSASSAPVATGNSSPDYDPNHTPFGWFLTTCIVTTVVIVLVVIIAWGHRQRRRKEVEDDERERQAVIAAQKIEDRREKAAQALGIDVLGRVGNAGANDAQEIWVPKPVYQTTRPFRSSTVEAHILPSLSKHAPQQHS